MRTRSETCPKLEHEYIAMREDGSYDPPRLFLYCQRCAMYRWSALEPLTEVPDEIRRSFDESDSRR